MEEKQPSITERKIIEVAKASNLTVRELKELVFQFQRQENKELKDVNDGLAEMLRNQQFHINQKEIRNQEIRLELEYDEIFPQYEELQKRRKDEREAKNNPDPEKKKKLFSITK